MKQLFYFFTFLTILSCKNAKVMSSDISRENENITPVQTGAQPKDSIIQKLRQEYEIVLAFEVETVAWAKTSSYKILVKKGNEWKGYTAFVSRTPQRNAPSLTPVKVDDKDAEDVWQFIKENEVAALSGDNGENFCDDPGKNCNINDGTIWHLLIATKNNFYDPTYYEPRFYEKCCPGNKGRKLFLEAVDKLTALIGDPEEAES